MYTKWSGGGVSCSLIGDEINFPTVSSVRLQNEQCGFEADPLPNITSILCLMATSSRRSDCPELGRTRDDSLCVRPHFPTKRKRSGTRQAACAYACPHSPRCPHQFKATHVCVKKN
jgi:hypothetical protein